MLLRMESDTIILTNQDFPERLHDMDVRIRKLQRTDFKAVAKIWREVLDIPVTDDELCETYEKMDGDDRYSTFVAEADGRVIGLVTMVTALAIGHPAGYSKVNGLGVLQEYRRNGIGKMPFERSRAGSYCEWDPICRTRFRLFKGGCASVL